ncbi:MAG: hypothetical protein WBB34_15175 [Xanthobacteraceae bacterium]
MAKRRRTPTAQASGAEKPAGRERRSEIVHTSVYLPKAVWEALRQIAFDERGKIHDLVMEGIGLALRKRGYPAVEAKPKSGAKSR